MRWRTPNAPRRSAVPRGPQRRAAAGFALTVVGAVGFAWAELAGADLRWQGVTLAAALAGLAYGFAAWTALLPPGPAVEEREPMPSPATDRRVLAEDLGRADGGIVSAPLPRRVLTAALSVLGLAVLVPLRSLRGSGPPADEALANTAWRAGVRVVRGDGTPVRLTDLDVGTALTVHPEGHVEDADAGVMLVRVPPERLALGPERQGWTVEGVVAYSKLCTHAGCPVGLFAQDTGQLLCPCHQSVFDVYHGAEPRFGPAARPLPQLPLSLGADGILVADGDFPTPPGPGYWRTS